MLLHSVMASAFFRVAFLASWCFVIATAAKGGTESGQQPKIIYDIKSLSGEPDYRSVNLTWEIDEIEIGDDQTKQESPERAFVVHYCEMQTWGAQRCKSKVSEEQQNRIEGQTRQQRLLNRQYSMVIDNLRMATKYSFQVKQKIRRDVGSGRESNFDDDNTYSNDINQGQSIIIPTKGFAAHANKCLAHASEIEVETGPYFGGKIMAENSDCQIEGNIHSAQESYIMQIDHERCGSSVNHNNLTVVTIITVQENLGIFTHSTRRFLVVCTYHPDTLTVRASFMVPGKGGAVVTSDEWQKIAPPTRNGRERQFKLVGRNALILRENDPDRDAGLAFLEEEDDHFNEIHHNVENQIKDDPEPKPVADRIKYSRLIEEETPRNYRTHAGQLHYERDRMTGIMIAVSLSVIMIGSVVYLLLRETKKQRIARAQLIQRMAQPY